MIGFGWWINLLFTLAMLALAWFDYRTFATPKHRDFKSIIMSTGVLGTFVGIFTGLLEFDTLKIEESVPPLLEGLKVAFYTSIMGMGLAIALTILQKSRNVKSDSQVAMDYFVQQASKLDSLHHLELFPRALEHLGAQHQLLARFDEAQKGQHERLYGLLEGNLGEVKRSLEAAISQLAQGASQEIVQALETVIRDFNQNLSEQFGENFKELNAATLKMIAWQENYKSSIEGIERSLALSQSSMESSRASLERIVETNEEVRRFYEELGELLRLYRAQNEELSGHLASFATLRERAEGSVVELHGLLGDSTKRFQTLAEESNLFTKELQERLGAQGTALQEESRQALQGFLTQSQSVREVMEENLQKAQESLQQLASENQAHTQALQGNLMASAKSLQEESTNEVKRFLEHASQTQEAIEGAMKEAIAQALGLHESTQASMREAQESWLSQGRALQEASREEVEEFLKQVESAREGASLSLAQVQEQSAHLNETSLQLMCQTQGRFQTLAEELSLFAKELQERLGAQGTALQEESRQVLQGFLTQSQSVREVMEENLQKAQESLQQLASENQAHTQALQGNLMASAKSLQEESTNEVKRFLEHASQTQEALERAMRAQSEAMRAHIQGEITHANQTLSDQLGAFSEEFRFLIKALRERLGAGAEEVLSALQKSLQESLEFFAKQEGAQKESTLELFNALKVRFEALSAEALQQQQAALGGMLEDSKAQGERFFSEWKQSSEATKEAILASQAQIRSSFEALTHSALSGLTLLAKALGEGIEGMKKSVSEVNSALAKESLQLSKEHAKAQLDLLSESAVAIGARLNELEEGTQKSLKNLALEYARLLQKLAKDSLNAPKEAGVQVMREFEGLQKEIAQSVASTNHALTTQRHEVDKALRILQEHLGDSLQESSQIRQNLLHSLRDLDGALSSLTGDFKRDYEWFLRRIKELIGSRSGL